PTAASIPCPAGSHDRSRPEDTMATPARDENAKLSSLFNKKKKKGTKTLNASSIVKESLAVQTPAAAVTAATPAPAAAKNAKPIATATAAPTRSPQRKPMKSPRPQSASPSQTKTSLPATAKTLADLSLDDKDEETTKAAFAWSKQPKKYKNPSTKETVAKTWEEQEERNRQSRRLNLDSERAFPTLGTDSAQAQLNSMKPTQAKSVESKNVWSTLHHDEEDDE
ncbi:TPA: hypothetical protein N0F65_000498, partial [Lagenidium giganteum]